MDDPNRITGMRTERVRIVRRNFRTYATLFRQFAERGGDVEMMRRFAVQAADCLDGAAEELQGVINADTVSTPQPEKE